MICMKAGLLFGVICTGQRNELIERSHMFKKGKNVVLCSAWNSSMQNQRLDTSWLESSFVEKDLGTLVDKKLNMTCKSASVARNINCIVSCIRKSVQLAGTRRELCSLFREKKAKGKPYCCLQLPTIAQEVSQAFLRGIQQENGEQQA